MVVQKFLVNIENGMQLQVSRAKYLEVHGSMPHNSIQVGYLQTTAAQYKIPAPFSPSASIMREMNNRNDMHHMYMPTIMNATRSKSEWNGMELDCKTCGTSFEKYEQLREHEVKCGKRGRTNTGDIMCRKCGKKFERKSQLPGHMGWCGRSNKESRCDY